MSAPYGSWCFPGVLSCIHMTGEEFLPHPDIIFLPTLLLLIGTRIPFSELFWISVSSHFVCKCPTLTYIKSYKCVELPGPSK